MTSLRIIVCLLVGLSFLAGNIVGYKSGWGDGAGSALNDVAKVKEEHDRIMHKLGLCKWAQIWAEDTRCKAERP